MDVRGSFLFSNSVTSNPRFAKKEASIDPESPPPTIITRVISFPNKLLC